MVVGSNMPLLIGEMGYQCQGRGRGEVGMFGSNTLGSAAGRRDRRPRGHFGAKEKGRGAPSSSFSIETDNVKSSAGHYLRVRVFALLALVLRFALRLVLRLALALVLAFARLFLTAMFSPSFG